MCVCVRTTCIRVDLYGSSSSPHLVNSYHDCNVYLVHGLLSKHEKLISPLLL
ncbi:hypothetical protein HanRHA438_Chr10g0433891 [Helianthus annuus]|nr:hypothetical protein HanHA89_Chr10g0368181 [Helianthus annuus]KAJ0698982.1 hypothetical protein HanOQP8_Chr10g0350781 [Helianthus annuus]KAJ0877917.1 hypothetical protein HanRHA438_Chr10g0433891 [Helianthus annuus]